jgi:hypothetical protein
MTNVPSECATTSTCELPVRCFRAAIRRSICAFTALLSAAPRVES